MRSTSSRTTPAVGLAVAADQHVLVEHPVEVGEDRGAHRVQRRDDVHALGDHLLRLLGGRALPDAQQPGGAAGDGRGQGHRRVDDELAGVQVLLEVRERLGLVAEGHAEDDDLRAAGGLRVLRPR